MFNKESLPNPIYGVEAQVQDYAYRYPQTDRWVLQGLNFQLNPGETVAVVGDSGSGKTTLFNSLTGFNHGFYKGGQHHGEISVNTENVGDVDLFKLSLMYGLVTQDYQSQLLGQTVESAIAFPMENQGMSREKMQAKVAHQLQLLSLDHIAHRTTSELSGGQGQAVVIAAMMVKDPRLMIFDDIVSALDRKGQILIHEIVENLKQSGVSMMITEPSDPKWLMQTADKVLILNNGKQDFFGDPEEVYTSPQLMRQCGLNIPEISFRKPWSGEAIIKFENVEFGYNGTNVLSQLNGEITKGAITGIVGHNGSGKTTLAKLCAGLYAPKSGSVLVDCQDPSRIQRTQAVRLVSYLHQHTSDIFFTDSAEEELAYVPRAIGVPTTVNLETIGLSSLNGEHPSYLSGGQKQRLALGRSLSANPEILVLDEPTTGLNQQERMQLVDQLLQLQSIGKTIILISHDWPMIARATNNVIVMDQGRIVRDGPTNEIMQENIFFTEIGLPLPW